MTVSVAVTFFPVVSVAMTVSVAVTMDVVVAVAVAPARGPSSWPQLVAPARGPSPWPLLKEKNYRQFVQAVFALCQGRNPSPPFGREERGWGTRTV